MKRYQVDAASFDGAKFMARYGIKQEDFHATYESGKMEVIIHDGVVLSDDPPVFEPSDTTNRDAKEALMTKLKAEDLTLEEVNELLRKEKGL